MQMMQSISRVALSLFVVPGVALAQGAGLHYPAAPKGSQVDVYHGVSISDPYRWLEDTDSPATLAWVQAENSLTFDYLARIPEREAIRKRLTTLWNYEKFSAPVKAGGRYFASRNSGLQNQDVLTVQEGLKGPERVLLDPNTLSSDGTVALTIRVPSPDGRYLGYGVAASGSDWEEFRVRDVATRADLADTLRWVKFSSLSWTKDNKGFFYSRYDKPAGGNVLLDANRNQKLYYHRVGQAQSRDHLVYDRPDQPDWLFSAEVSEDGQYAVISVSQGTDVRNRLYYIDLNNPGKPDINAPPVRLVDRFDGSYEFVGNSGTTFYVLTDRLAPRSRLVGISIDFPKEERWFTAIPEARDALKSVRFAGKLAVAEYLQDAHSTLRLYAPPGENHKNDGRRVQGQAQNRTDGRGGYDDAGGGGRVAGGENLRGGSFALKGEIPLPGIGSADLATTRKDDDEVFYSFVSYLSPRAVYRYDLKSRRNEIFRQPKVGFDPSAYETRQVFFNSKDGTRVPIFITARKGIALDGNNPTLLYAYGGFNISQTPAFSAANLMWMEMGGIFAVANIRGGGEYGKEWHEAGMLSKKQNVFDDFIGAAEFLIREKYTSTPRLAVRGGSNDGLLVGAVMTQRPDLFGAALPEVGVMDMLRFQKFTIGWAWASDYGSSDDPAQFAVLRAYSPLHNIRKGTCYPPTLAMTADHDDRVVPGHTFKFMATLQAAQECANPVLVRIATKAGHGAGKPTSKVIDEAADRLAFLVRNLKMTPRLQQ